jgi:hypothetical protein
MKRRIRCLLMSSWNLSLVVYGYVVPKNSYDILLGKVATAGCRSARGSGSC